MTTEFLILLLQSQIILFLFWILYRTKLRSEKRFQLNRIWLLLGMGLAIILPFTPALQFGTEPLVQVTLPELQLGYSGDTGNDIASDGVNPLFALYLLGLGLGTLFIIVQLYKLVSLRIRSRKVATGYFTIPQSTDSFSFLNWVFIGEALDGELRKTIEAHEEAHRKGLHSLDILLIRVIRIANWFNPLLKFYENAIKENHEFIADSESLQNKDSDTYVNQLINTVAIRRNRLAHSFHEKSLIKKRIQMIYSKSKPSRILYSVIFMSFILSASVLVGCTGYNVEQDLSEVNTGEKIHQVADKMPEYPGGMEKMFAFMQDEIKYPEELKEQGVEGKLVISFIVDSQGNVKDVKMLQGLHELFDQEALRAVEAMPNWIPGEIDGKPVSVEMKLPVQWTVGD